jgi:hypothetical protein
MKGILFSPEMSAATREGRKTQTRRLMSPQPDFIPVGWVTTHTYEKKAPLKPGDILYVREEHYAYGVWQPNGLTASGRKKWKFKTTGAHYFPDEKEQKDITCFSNSCRREGWYKRLGRFMPKAYARTFLEVTDVRVQQIRDISESDAIAEGIQLVPDSGGRYKDYTSRSEWAGGCVPKTSFFSLWQSIHIDKADPQWLERWHEEREKWVFAYTFKQIAKP